MSARLDDCGQLPLLARVDMRASTGSITKV